MLSRNVIFRFSCPDPGLYISLFLNKITLNFSNILFSLNLLKNLFSKHCKKRDLIFIYRVLPYLSFLHKVCARCGRNMHTTHWVAYHRWRPLQKGRSKTGRIFLTQSTRQWTSAYWHQWSELEQPACGCLASEVLLKWTTRFTCHIWLEFYYNIRYNQRLDFTFAPLFLELYGEFLNACQIESHQMRLLAIKKLLTRLPQHNYETIKFLSAHLRRVAAAYYYNKMTIKNLSISFSQSIVRHNLANSEQIRSDHIYQSNILELWLIYVIWT